MSAQSMKPGWKMVKFGDVVKNANLVERDLEAAGIERIVGLEHLDPENLHIRRWNSPENGTSFSRKFVSGQTLFGKRRAYQRKVAFAEFEGICSGYILTFEKQGQEHSFAGMLPFICQSDAFFDHALVHRLVLFHREPAGRRSKVLNSPSRPSRSRSVLPTSCGWRMRR